jgi:hypothetical protein
MANNDDGYCLKFRKKIKKLYEGSIGDSEEDGDIFIVLTRESAS